MTLIKETVGFVKRLWGYLNGKKRILGGSLFLIVSVLVQWAVLSPEEAKALLNVGELIFGVGMAHYAQKALKTHFNISVEQLLTLFKKK